MLSLPLPRSFRTNTALLVLFFPVGAASQTFSADSIRIHRDASDAQATFELQRRHHFPWTWPTSGGECDERIGRFCLTHQEDGTDWEAPPESEEVRTERERLIGVLQDAARRLPGDNWIAGQLVRYLVEAHRAEEALEAARSCRAPDGWCAALEGFVHHSRGDAVRANSSFDAGLRMMPAAQRARWTDLSVLLRGDVRDAYVRLTDEERQRFEARFWWLADPLYMRPGNDRRAEHFARWVMVQILEEAESPENQSWGGDLEELLIRYGWPVGWERERNRPLALGPASIISHYPPRDRYFLPTEKILTESTAVAPGDWQLELERPRAGYSPLYGAGFGPPDYQLARFRKGDSITIIAAVQLPADSFSSGTAALVAGMDSSSIRMAAVDLLDGRGVLSLTVPAGPILVSIEILDEVNGRAARDRFGYSVPGRASDPFALSELLLLDGEANLQDSIAAPPPLAEIALRALSDLTLDSEDRLGVYWELYGLESPEPVSITLTLSEQEPGWVHRLARRIGLSEEEIPVRLRWQEVATGRVFARALTVDLDRVEPGEYVLEIRVRARGREEVATSRNLTIVR